MPSCMVATTQGEKQQEHHNTVGKLSKNSVYSASGVFIGQVDFAETTEMENRNGNIERKKIVLATVLRQELYSFLVRLLHVGQRGD